jgi:trimeric autotransporter adhesin
LKAQVAALQTQVDKLQTQLTAVQSNNALKLGPFVSVNPKGTGLDNGVTGPNIYFTGANIHIVSGSTTTVDTVTGLGNLIIGYNEPPPVIFPGSRSGSHNLIIGRFNSFFQAAFGGLVVGEANIISAEGASVSGGGSNIASGTGASVSGGGNNIASGTGASVSGGGNNIASGSGASVSGGGHNIASGSGASVSGGFGNTASGTAASVTGGQFNNVGGIEAVVIGGLQVTDNADRSIAPQPPFP